MLLWTFVDRTFSFLLPRNTYLGVEVLGHMVTISKCPHPFTIPPAMYASSIFSTSLPTLTIVCLFCNNRPGGCEVVCHYGFDLHFPDD